MFCACIFYFLIKCTRGFVYGYSVHSDIFNKIFQRGTLTLSNMEKAILICVHVYPFINKQLRLTTGIHTMDNPFIKELSCTNKQLVGIKSKQ